jgi:hypothetical protein
MTGAGSSTYADLENRRQHDRIVASKSIFNKNSEFLTVWYHTNFRSFSDVLWSIIYGGLTMSSLQYYHMIRLHMYISEMNSYANLLCASHEIRDSKEKIDQLYQQTCNELHHFAHAVGYPKENVYCDRVMEA